MKPDPLQTLIDRIDGLCESMAEDRERTRDLERTLQRALEQSAQERDRAIEANLRKSREEFDRKIEASHQRSREEFDRKIEASIKQFRQEMRQSKEEFRQEMQKFFNQMDGTFSSRWGRLVEALVAPGCLEQFRRRGIAVEQMSQRTEGVDERGRRQIEVDVLLHNGRETVVIEVKSVLKVADVDEFVEKMPRIKQFVKACRGKRLFGGVAALQFDSRVDRYAYRQGLFVLRPEESLVRIANGLEFQPKPF